jgi:hypothetical protein
MALNSGALPKGTANTVALTNYNAAMTQLDAAFPLKAVDIDTDAVETLKIKAKAVTLPKQADIATLSLLGRRTAAAGQIEVIGIADAVYPIGAIYMSVVSTSPATLFGGTWTAFGAGRVLVSRDAGDADFDTVEETGGAKTVSIAHTHTTPDHTLTTTEMPAHDHEQTISLKDATTNDGTDIFGGLSGGTNGSRVIGVADTGGGAAHNHGPTGAMSANATPSIVQPYIVVYMWKRTA